MIWKKGPDRRAERLDISRGVRTGRRPATLQALRPPPGSEVIAYGGRPL